jgi:hypothetical protein
MLPEQVPWAGTCDGGEACGRSHLVLANITILPVRSILWFDVGDSISRSNLADIQCSMTQPPCNGNTVILRRIADQRIGQGLIGQQEHSLIPHMRPQPVIKFLHRRTEEWQFAAATDQQDGKPAVLPECSGVGISTALGIPDHTAQYLLKPLLELSFCQPNAVSSCSRGTRYGSIFSAKGANGSCLSRRYSARSSCTLLIAEIRSLWSLMVPSS